MRILDELYSRIPSLLLGRKGSQQTVTGPYTQPEQSSLHPSIHLSIDRRLTWHKHIFTKRNQRGLTLTKMHWLLGRGSKLSTTNKLPLYKTILKPIWTYGKQLWGTASTSNIEILERFQSKVLRFVVDAPWYVPNSLFRRDLSCPTVRLDSSHYGDRHLTHPNHLAVNLRLPDNRRLGLFLPTDLPDRF
jgi:hypothetical protein